MTSMAISRGLPGHPASSGRGHQRRVCERRVDRLRARWLHGFGMFFSRAPTDSKSRATWSASCGITRRPMRTFQISYHMTGLAVAYDDVVDVNLQVWGDQWAVGLEHLEASAILRTRRRARRLPRVRASIWWTGRRRWDPTRSPPLVANNVPVLWVELRTVFPSFSHPPTEPGRPGTGWEAILAEEGIRRGGLGCDDCSKDGACLGR